MAEKPGFIPELERSVFEEADELAPVVTAEEVVKSLDRVEEGIFELSYGNILDANLPLQDKSDRLKSLEQLSTQVIGRGVWESFCTPREIPYFEKKKNYREVDSYQHNHRDVLKVQALSNGEILVGAAGTIFILSKDETGEWEKDIIGYPNQTKEICGMQLMPDKEAIYIDGSKKLTVMTRRRKGTWFGLGHPLENTLTSLAAQTSNIKSEITSVQIMPDKKVVVATTDGLVVALPREIAPLSFYDKREIICKLDQAVNAIQVLRDGRVITGGQDGFIRIWDKGADEKWRFEKVGKNNSSVRCLQMSMDGRIVSANEDGGINLFSKDPKGRWRKEIVAPEKTDITKVLQFLPDGEFVTAGGMGEIYFWQKGADGVWQKEVMGKHEGPVLDLQVLRSGRIVSCAKDGTVKVFDGDPIEEENG